MSVEELSETEGQIQNAISEINELAESYPELKASINFMELQRAITNSEDNLQAVRRAYNEPYQNTMEKWLLFQAV